MDYSSGARAALPGKPLPIAWAEPSPAKGNGFFAELKLSATVRGVRIALETFSVRDEMHYSAWTRVRGSVLDRASGTVYRDGEFYPIGTFFPGPDIELFGGNATRRSFDEMFFVKTLQPVVMRAQWSPRARELMRRHFVSARLEQTPDEISLVAPGWWRGVDRMLTAVELVAELGSRDLFGRAALSELAGASLAADAHGVPVAEVFLPAQVSVTVTSESGSLASVALLRQPIALEDRTLEIMGGRLHEADRRLPERALRAAAEVGNAELVIRDGRARVVWPRVIRSAIELGAGAELLGALVAPSMGVFR